MKTSPIVEPDEFADTFKAPDLTVIIPTYNEEGSVVKAIESATIQQPGLKVEVIVVDDSSLDETVSKVEELQKIIENITIVKLKQNKGKAAALNRVINKATGDFVTFLDGDDYFEPDGLTKLIGRLKDFRYNVDTKMFAYGQTRYHGKSNNLHVPSVDVTLKHFARFNPVCSVIFVPREALQKSGIRFDPDPRVWEDWLFMARLVQNGFKPIPFADILVLHYNFDDTGRYAYGVSVGATQNTLRKINER